MEPRRLSYLEEKDAVKAAIEKFKQEYNDEFELWGFPGAKFRVSERSSYFTIILNDSPNEYMGGVYLYLERNFDGKWSDFVKGSQTEVRNQIPSRCRRSERT